MRGALAADGLTPRADTHMVVVDDDEEGSAEVWIPLEPALRPVSSRPHFATNGDSTPVSSDLGNSTLRTEVSCFKVGVE